MKPRTLQISFQWSKVKMNSTNFFPMIERQKVKWIVYSKHYKNLKRLRVVRDLILFNITTRYLQQNDFYNDSNDFFSMVLRVCLEFAYFAETEIFLLKVM